MCCATVICCRFLSVYVSFLLSVIWNRAQNVMPLVRNTPRKSYCYKLGLLSCLSVISLQQIGYIMYKMHKVALSKYGWKSIIQYSLYAFITDKYRTRHAIFTLNLAEQTEISIFRFENS